MRPVSLAGGDDQARVVRQEPLRAELQSFHGARREVLDEHVGGLDQVEQRVAAGVGLQVEHHAALVGVEHHELVRLDRLVRAEPQRLPTRRLDLDDVGAELCEKQPAVRAVVDLAQFQDPDAVEGRAWLFLLFDRCASRSSPVGFARRGSFGSAAQALLTPLAPPRM